MFIITRDNEPMKTANTYNEALLKLQKMQSFSYDHATKYEGWAIVERKYIVELPFKGHIQTTMTGGFIDYTTEKMTFEEYKKQERFKGRNLQVISSQELDKLIAEEREQLIQPFIEINEERYDYMLGVLPPMNFDGSYFQISEALKYDLRATFIQVDDKYYEATLPTGSAKKNKKYIDQIK